MQFAKSQTRETAPSPRPSPRTRGEGGRRPISNARHCQNRAPPIPMGGTPRKRARIRTKRGGHEHDRARAAMNDAAIAADASISVNGAKLELIDRGRGRPILFLHPHIGIEPSAPVLALLADGGRLVAPSHPGFGNSELPPTLTTVDDLAYFYLDAMDELDLEQALVVGVSLRRLDRGGDRGEVDRADVAARPRQSGRHQGRRPREPRHPRRVRDDRDGVSREGLRRSGGGRARLRAP